MRRTEQLGRAIGVGLPLRLPHQIARQVLANENLRRILDLHQPKARDAAFDRSREIHRRPRRNAALFELPIRTVRILGGQCERGKTLSPLEELTVIVEPRMRPRRSQQFDVRRCEHHALVLRADAVNAARRERESVPREAGGGRVEIAYRDHGMVNGEWQRQAF